MGDPKESSITLSEEWAELSAEFCCPEFIKSLGTFFESNQIQTLLECACGDGHVLNGLAEKIKTGVGIDSDEYLIQRAQEQKHPSNITFKNADILDIDTDNDLKDGSFDAVMLRGNSITALGAWGTQKETFDFKRCEQMIRKSLMKMWSKLRESGLFYLDVTKQSDIDKGNHTLQINSGNIHLIGEITIDVERRRRDVFGQGTINGKPFYGGSSSYLIGPEGLKNILNELLRPKEIWIPSGVKDAMYEIICVRK